MMLPMKKLYMSYAPEDVEIAAQLSAYLDKDGFQTLITPSPMTGAAIHDRTNIYESIAELRAVIILLTPHSLSDEHVKRETNLAIENGIPIYPVNLSGEEQLKTLLTPEWRYWLSITQILTCKDSREAFRKLRFRISADSASNMEIDSMARQSIIGSWRAFESIIEQIEIAKMSHSFIDFQELHSQFDKEIAPGFSEFSKSYKLADKEFKVENRLAGKMLFGIFMSLQYFDCHSLTVNRINWCGLKGHEIETLTDKYVKPAAISFEYPLAINWYTETQFLWNYNDFLEMCPTLLNAEKFPIHVEILTHDFESYYAEMDVSQLRLEGLNYNPRLALKSQIFDELCKMIFFSNISVIANENVPRIDLENTLKSITEFIEQSIFEPGELGSLALNREEFLLRGYPTLLLFRAYLVSLLGQEEEASSAIQKLSESDQNLIRDFLTINVPASNGVGRALLEQLAGFFRTNYHGDFPEFAQIEENLFVPGKKTFFVAEQLYFLADKFNESGDSDAALDLWAKAARGGFIPGLTSFTWVTLQKGSFDAGIALFEELNDVACEPEFETEKLNAHGNYLLNRLAIDNDYAGALKSFKEMILEESDDTSFINHISLITLEFQFGDPEEAVRVLESIPSTVLTQFKQAYEDEATSANGWHLDWCSQVLRVINEIFNDKNSKGRLSRIEKAESRDRL
jgi:tetratricopeptide (TPR) repeat protein